MSLYTLLKELNEWSGLLMGIMVGVGFFCKPIRNWFRKKFIMPDQKQDADIAILKEAILGILHDRIYALCTHYIEQGYMTVEDAKNLKHLYQPYKALGGNDVCQKLYTHCMEHVLVRKEMKE